MLGIRSLRPRHVLAVACLSLASVAMGVMARDMALQLRLIEAHQDRGAVIHGEIVSSSPASLPDGGLDLPWTRLEITVDRSIVGEHDGQTLTVFSPGNGERRLSISPPESSVRVGASVLMFLRADPMVRQVDPTSWKLDSFAEVFRTQKNGRDETIVLGHGYGSAVVDNERMSDLEPRVRTTLASVKSQSPDGK